MPHESCSSSAATRAPPWWRRLGWLVLIWVASVAALAVVASALKLLMTAAGLTT